MYNKSEDFFVYSYDYSRVAAAVRTSAYLQLFPRRLQVEVEVLSMCRVFGCSIIRTNIFYVSFTGSIHRIVMSGNKPTRHVARNPNAAFVVAQRSRSSSSSSSQPPPLGRGGKRPGNEEHIEPETHPETANKRPVGQTSHRPAGRRLRGLLNRPRAVPWSHDFPPRLLKNGHY